MLGVLCVGGFACWCVGGFLDRGWCSAVVYWGGLFSLCGVMGRLGQVG